MQGVDVLVRGRVDGVDDMHSAGDGALYEPGGEYLGFGAPTVRVGLVDVEDEGDLAVVRLELDAGPVFPCYLCASAIAEVFSSSRARGHW